MHRRAEWVALAACAATILACGRPPTAPRARPGLHATRPFAQRWDARFDILPDGSLRLRSEAQRKRLAITLPASAAGASRIEVQGAKDVWVSERLEGAAASARAKQVDGRVVYSQVRPGIDQIFEASGARSEEYLRIASPEALAGVRYQVQVGEAVSDLVVDGSGRGLVARGAGGRALLKAPGPEGTDANGGYVKARLVATRTADRTYELHIELVTRNVAFPVLLDPSWVTVGSMSSTHSRGTQTLLSDGRVLVAAGFSSGQTTSTEIYDPNTGTWSATGDTEIIRANGMAVLLASGEVLLLGGDEGSNMTGVCELYDPTTGAWSYTGSLNVARDYATATLLADGKVLAAGGGFNGLTSAELYDPSTGTWTATNPMNVARSAHSAVRLADGKVLVLGGLVNIDLPDPWTATAELYDETTGDWTLTTGSLEQGRDGIAATVLPSGEVLAAGGARNSNLVDTEVYDPSTETFAVVGSLGTARSSAAAVLLPDGQTFIAGGAGGAFTMEMYQPDAGAWQDGGALPVVHAEINATLLASGEVLTQGNDSTVTNVFDPRNPSWSATGSMSTGRSFFTATLLPSGEVLAVGGFDPKQNHLYSAELYDPDAGTWSPTASTSDDHVGHTATLLPDGKVLVVGGEYKHSAELYDPGTRTWSDGGSLNIIHWQHTATLLPSGKVLIAGGERGDNTATNDAEIYDPDTGSFADAGAMAVARVAHTATLLPSGKVLVAGGGDDRGFSLSSAEIYDPSSGTWADAGSMTSARQGHIAALLPDGEVLVAGGSDANSTSTSTAELYDPGTGTWTPTGSMNSDRIKPAAALLPDGRVLVAEGIGNGVTSSAEIFDPRTGLWTSTPSATASAWGAEAVVLPDQKLLVVGGSDGSFTPSSAASLFDLGGGYTDSERPVLTSAPALAAAGTTITVSGTNLIGFGEASDGYGSVNSPTDYPVAVFQRVDNGALYDGRTRDTSGAWKASSSTLNVAVPTGAEPGPYRMWLVTSGIPSTSAPVVLERGQGQACFEDGECITGHCADSVCCDSACGGSTTDCEACSVAAGAAVDGTCGAVSDGLFCSDGDLCTQADTCQGGSCVSGTPVSCPALDQCHSAGVCDPVTGCSAPQVADGTPCDAGMGCLTAACEFGSCAVQSDNCCSSDADCADAGPCHSATCDASSHTCQVATLPDATPCDDGNPCTLGETCTGGSCGQPTGAVTCAALDDCHVAGICDPLAGGCTNPAADAGTACADGGGLCDGAGRCVIATTTGGSSSSGSSGTGSSGSSSSSSGSNTGGSGSSSSSSGSNTGSSGSSGTSSSSSGSTGGTGSSGSGSSGSASASSSGGSSSGGTSASSTSGSGSGSSGTASTGSTPGAAGGGCGCDAGGASDPLLMMLGIVAAFELRRRRGATRADSAQTRRD